MIHVLPGFEDNIGSLALGAIREGLNAVIQNLGTPSLNVNGRKAAQVSGALAVSSRPVNL